MPTNVNVTPSFHIITVFRLWAELVAKNILFWLFLIVAINFISWKFLQELLEAFASYPIFYPISETAANLIDSVPNHELLDSIGQIVPFLSYAMLLQVVVSPLIYDLLKKKKSDNKIRSEDIAAIFQKERGDFILDLVRTLGITLLITGVSILVTLIFLYPILNLRNGEHIIGYVVMILSILLAYFNVRMSLAVPMAVIENMGVIMSLIGSWNLTATCWKKIIVVNVIVAVPVLMVLTTLIAFYSFVLARSEIFLNGANGMELIKYVYQMIHFGLSAIAIAICYYYLCNSKGDGSENDLR